MAPLPYIRPITAGDAERVATAFEGLSDRSRYQRFLAPKPRLSSSELRYLTDVDQRRHVALAAVDPADGAFVGIARYATAAGDHDTADVAVVVADAWQRRGVGTILFERLTARAREAGVERITARMIVGNEAARRLIARQADTLTEQRETGAILLTARLRG